MIPSLQDPNSLWPVHCQVGRQQVTTPNSCLHHRRVYLRSSSYKQQVGREPCKGRKKAETHLPPHLCLVIKAAAGDQCKNWTTGRLQTRQQPASLPAPEQTWERPVGSTAPVQIKHTPGCHVSGYCITGPNTWEAPLGCITTVFMTLPRCAF